MSDSYRGNDPLLTIINNYFYHIRKKENKKVFNSFKHDLHFNNIIVGAGIESFLSSQYCSYIMKHYVLDGDKTIQLYPKEKINPESFFKSRNDFLREEYEFPIKETFRQMQCRCNGSPLTCPNCCATNVVTCPDCYSKRDGQCNGCRGAGTVECNVCNGSTKCIACNGSPTCRNCLGSGKITCLGCNWGKVKDYRIVTCTSCNGHGSREHYSSYGYDNNTNQWKSGQITERCSSCGGSGNKEEQYEKDHPDCNGTGKKTCNLCSGRGHCSKCDGSGKCTTCNGTGILTCKKCDGDGSCTRCSGQGTLRCPTCNAEGIISCPICEGTNMITTYSADVFRFDHIHESRSTFSSFYDPTNWTLDSRCNINLKYLTETVVESELGVLNKLIKQTLTDEKIKFDEMLDISKRREINLEFPDPINEQNEIYLKLQRKQDHNWEESTYKDSSVNKFILSFSSYDRVSPAYDQSTNSLNNTHGITIRKLIYQDHHHNLQPLNEVNLEIDDKSLSIICKGIKSYNEFKILDDSTDVDFAMDLINTDHNRSIEPPSEKSSILRTVLSLGTQRTKKVIKLVLVIGNEEHLKFAIFKKFGQLIQNADLGIIDDLFFSQIINPQTPFSDVGVTSAYSISVDKHKTIILVNIHPSSLLQKHPETKRMLNICDLFIWVTKNAEELKDLNDGKFGQKMIGLLVGSQNLEIVQKCLKVIQCTTQQFDESLDSIVQTEIITNTIRFLFDEKSRHA